MAGNDESGEKTHEPTPQKLEDARRRGEVPKSQDVAAAAIYIFALVAFGAFGTQAAIGSGEVLAGIIGASDLLAGRLLGPGGGALSLSLVGQAIGPLIPILLAPAVAALIAYAAQRAIVAAPEKLAPKLSRINPISNAKNKYGPTGLVEFLKSAVKLTAISTVLFLFLVAETDHIAALVRADARAVGPEMMRVGISLLSVIAAIAVVIGAIDFLWQRFDHARKNRMSFQEMKEEVKKSEGDPTMKSERRRRAHAIATNRMLMDVPDADVVLTNPTHVAVALKWSRKPGSAPVCVAKGEDDVAAAIRRIAAENGVPIHHDPPTARALNAAVEIGDEILPEHYQAVAAAIRYAQKMRDIARDRGWGRPS